MAAAGWAVAAGEAEEAEGWAVGAGEAASTEGEAQATAMRVAEATPAAVRG